MAVGALKCALHSIIMKGKMKQLRDMGNNILGNTLGQKGCEQHISHKGMNNPNSVPEIGTKKANHKWQKAKMETPTNTSCIQPWLCL